MYVSNAVEIAVETAKDLKMKYDKVTDDYTKDVMSKNYEL